MMERTAFNLFACKYSTLLGEERRKAKTSVMVVSFHFCMGLQRQPVTLSRRVSKLYLIYCVHFFYYRVRHFITNGTTLKVYYLIRMKSKQKKTKKPLLIMVFFFLPFFLLHLSNVMQLLFTLNILLNKYFNAQCQTDWLIDKSTS